MSALVVHVVHIDKHPNADFLELLELSNDIVVVAGMHYRKDQRGVYFSSGTLLPGYLAEHLWLRGSASTNEWVLVGLKNMRGIQSPGMFAGSEFQNDRESPWQPWPMWRERWKEGDDVSAFLGVRPSTRERTNFDPAVKTTADGTQGMKRGVT